MTTGLSPDRLPAIGSRYDVFLSFTRKTAGAEEKIGQIARTLEVSGLTVFWDARIDEFDGITANLVDALAGSTVLLAYYSRDYPSRYAFQWELTAAWLAAQRLGDPRFFDAVRTLPRISAGWSGASRRRCVRFMGAPGGDVPAGPGAPVGDSSNTITADADHASVSAPCPPHLPAVTGCRRAPRLV